MRDIPRPSTPAPTSSTPAAATTRTSWCRRSRPDDPALPFAPAPRTASKLALGPHNIPAEHLLRQLYTFSPSYDPDEAYAGITGCNFWYFTEELAEAARVLSRQVGLDLHPLVANGSSAKAIVTQGQMKLLRELLHPEIELYRRLRTARPISIAAA